MSSASYSEHDTKDDSNPSVVADNKYTLFRTNLNMLDHAGSFYTDSERSKRESKYTPVWAIFVTARVKNCAFRYRKKMVMRLFALITGCYKMAHGLLFKLTAIDKYVLAVKKSNMKKVIK